MSKTWRRNPEGGGRRDPFERRSEQPDEITAEWAVSRLRRHVSSLLDELIEDGLIDSADKPDYAEIVNRRIAAAAPLYDAGRKSRINGRTSSAVHFLRIVADRTALNIRQYQETKMKTHVPIGNVSEEDAEECGVISVEGRHLGDGCRSFIKLWLRMDLDTLNAVLADDERFVVAMRLRGYNDMEIAAEMGDGDPDSVEKLRLSIQRTISRRIVRKARKCGFCPASEGGLLKIF